MFTFDEQGFAYEPDAREGAHRDKQFVPTADPLAGEASRMVSRTFHAHMRSMDRLQAEFGLSGARFSVLRVVYTAEGQRLRMNEIAQHLFVTPTSVTRLVAGLIQDGLVARERDPEDKRTILVRLTPAGEARFEAIMPPRVKRTDDDLSGLSQQEKRLLIHLLAKLRMTMFARSLEPTIYEPRVFDAASAPNSEALSPKPPPTQRGYRQN